MLLSATIRKHQIMWFADRKICQDPAKSRSGEYGWYKLEPGIELQSTPSWSIEPMRKGCYGFEKHLESQIHRGKMFSIKETD